VYTRTKALLVKITKFYSRVGIVKIFLTIFYFVEKVFDFLKMA